MDVVSFDERLGSISSQLSNVRGRISTNEKEIGRIETGVLKNRVIISFLLFLVFFIPIFISVMTIYFTERRKLKIVDVHLPHDWENAYYFDSEKFLYNGYRWWFRMKSTDDSEVQLKLCFSEDKEVVMRYGSFKLTRVLHDPLTFYDYVFPMNYIQNVVVPRECLEVEYAGSFDEEVNHYEGKVRIAFLFESV